MNITMNITIKQIAEKLKVSPGTVSLALSGSPLVASKTRDLVQKTADEMASTRTLWRTTRSSLASLHVSSSTSTTISRARSLLTTSHHCVATSLRVSCRSWRVAHTAAPTRPSVSVALFGTTFVVGLSIAELWKCS